MLFQKIQQSPGTIRVEFASGEVVFCANSMFLGKCSLPWHGANFYDVGAHVDG